MAIYIDSSDIQKTIKAARWTELSADANAVTHAVDETNAEIESIISKTYADLASVPDIIRKHGGIIGRYWLYNYHELVDNDGYIYKDCKDSRKALADISAGLLTGINDSTTTDDDPIRHSARDRRYDADLWY